jgi:hypothetical protein
MEPGDFLPVAGAVRAASSLAESEAAKNVIILEKNTEKGRHDILYDNTLHNDIQHNET